MILPHKEWLHHLRFSRSPAPFNKSNVPSADGHLEVMEPKGRYDEGDGGVDHEMM